MLQSQGPAIVCLHASMPCTFYSSSVRRNALPIFTHNALLVPLISTPTLSGTTIVVCVTNSATYLVK